MRSRLFLVAFFVAGSAFAQSTSDQAPLSFAFASQAGTGIYDLNGQITEVVRALQAHEHVEFTTRLAANLPRVVGDPIALRRILEDLMANAVGALESKPGRVTVSTEQVSGAGEAPAIRVTVADTGRGMSAEETGKIFNDFYTTKEGGSGLGLSIVRRLVMDLQGTVGVDSTPGKGTAITIDIPIAR